MTKHTAGVLAIHHVMFQQLSIAVLPQKYLKDWEETTPPDTVVEAAVL